MNPINFIQNSEQLASSGQPTQNEIQEIADLGYSTIVNVALSSSDNAIAHEGDIVTNAGMSYIHIPIQWESPRIEQFELFASVLRKLDSQKVWVHCALNMRVSAFIYLYNVLHLGISDEDAKSQLNRVWQPNPIWSDFINKTIQRLG